MLLSIAVATGGPADAQSATQLVVAVNLQRDPGDVMTILPIARFTGSEWLNTWPGPADRRTPAPALTEIPTDWLGGPVPRQWTFFSPAGAAVPVKVTGATRGASGCETSVELIVAGPPPAPRDPWAPGATRIAIAGDAKPEWIRAVSADNPAMPALVRVIHREHQYNQQLIGAAKIAEWTDGLAALDRAGASLQVQTLVRSASDTGPVLYYFDASRRTPSGVRPAFMLHVSGWMGANPDGELATRNVSRGAFVGEYRPKLEPIAALRTGSRVVWLSRLTGYESLSFVLDDVTGDAVRRLITAVSDGC